jgi:hypothetical protein
MENFLSGGEKEAAFRHAFSAYDDASVGMAGDFMGRKGGGHPGAKILWCGMQALHYFVAGMRAYVRRVSLRRCATRS